MTPTVLVPSLARIAREDPLSTKLLVATSFGEGSELLRARALLSGGWTTEAPAGWAAPGEGEPDAARRTHVEGVIDLAFREPDGRVIADYKTDVRTDPDFPAREAGYRAQVELYAACWELLVGESVKERVLFYTRGGIQEVW